MKKNSYKSAHLLIIAIVHLLISSSIFAQAPQKMSYQAIIRNSNDSLLVLSQVGMRISIVQSSPTGTVVYSETQTATTNANGLVSLQIGMGTAVSGTFTGINWAAGPYYVKTETDLAGGTNYTIISSNELLSVPYALFSANGTPGPEGPQGPQGIAGINGANGLNALIKTTTEPAGANCTNGGTKIETGLDANANNILDASEVSSSQTQYLCNTGLPIVTTDSINNDNCSFCINVSGNILSNGGETIIFRGFCFGLSPNPTTDGQYIIMSGPSSSVFSYNDCSFIPNTTYYFRAYAINSNGTAYGNELSFTTPAFIITTSAVTDIYAFSATSGGALSSTQCINHKGVCWSTSANPTLADRYVYEWEDSPFTSSIYGLTPNTTYYVRAFAGIYGAPTYYGNELSFTTPNFVITTAAVSDITAFSATSGGGVSDQNLNGLGVCWSTSDNPSLENSSASYTQYDGSSFTSSISGLVPNTTYYVRAYATYNGVTYYGNELSFTTPSLVTTTAASDITAFSATSGGALTTTENINQTGVCWSTSANPTTADNVTQDGGSSPFTSSISGLAPNTTYYLRAFASDYNGQTYYGNQVSFTTPAFVITTTAVNDITAVSATSGGALSTTQNIVNKGVCWSTSSNPTIADNVTQEWGSSPFTSSMSGLAPNTSYYVRAYATNSAGTVYGNEQIFTTLTIVLPTVTTTAVSAIATDFASSGATITSDGGATVSAWGVCWSTSTNPTLANNFANVGLSGLTQNTTYYVRAYATNSAGTAYGNEVSFTTLAIVLPTVTTTGVFSITNFSASSGGAVTSNGGAALSAWGVCWSTSANPTLANSFLQNTVSSGSFSSALSGLTQNTTYYVRAYATNSAGTAYGNEQSFTTTNTTTDFVLPTITTFAVSAITTTSASSGGAVTSDGGAALSAWGVCWSTSANPILANSFLQNNGIAGFFSSSLSGLTPNTTYYLRAYATNSAGTAYGNEQSFTTTDTNVVLPTITTTAVSAITPTSAIIGATITSDGGATLSALGVCWSTSANPTLANSFLQHNVSTTIFGSALSGLTQNTTYYVSAYATNSAGTVYGNELSFTTLAIVIPIVTTTAITSITSTSANSGGTLTYDGGATVSAWGVCWSTSANPTLANSFLQNTVSSGSFSSALSGLTLNTTYYVRAFASNSAGTAYGNEQSFTTTSNFFAIGQSYQGGIIAYIDFSGIHGLIAAPSDLGFAPWGCYGTEISGADGTAIGTGNQNTIDIMTGCNEAGIAARLCGDLVLGGYSDWYLPSKDEFNQLYINRAYIGGFTSFVYWSSTEGGTNDAWVFSFSNGGQVSINKDYTLYVRAVRAF